MLIALAIHLIAGVSFALAAVKLHGSQTLLRSTGLWTLLGFSLLFAGPVLAVVMRSNPEWFFHYFTEIDRFDWPLVAALLPVTGAGVGAYAGSRALLVRRPRRMTQTVVLVAGFAIAGLLVLLGWWRIAVVGSTAQVIAEAGTRPLDETTEGYVLAGAMAVIGLGWLATLWRLFLFARAIPIATRFVGSVPVRDGRTQALPGRESQPEKKPGPKKKARAPS